MEEDSCKGQRKAFTRPVATTVGRLSVRKKNSGALPGWHGEEKRVRRSASEVGTMFVVVESGLQRIPEGIRPVKDVDAIAFVVDLALVIAMRKSQDIGDRVRKTVKLVMD